MFNIAHSRRFVEKVVAEVAPELAVFPRWSPLEILDDRRRISNPGFARDIHQRLPVDDADGAPSEHRVAKSRRHA